MHLVADVSQKSLIILPGAEVYNQVVKINVHNCETTTTQTNWTVM